jgi:hypothetical protein
VLGKSSCANCERGITVVEIKNGEKDLRYTTLEALQNNWKADPNWDIEKTEGFEAYRDELSAWRKTYELECDLREKKRKHKRAYFMREQTGVKNFDIALALHTFNEIEHEVSAQDRYIGEFDNVANQVKVELMQAQIRATLLLAAQVERVADELKEMRLHGLIVGQA